MILAAQMNAVNHRAELKDDANRLIFLDIEVNAVFARAEPLAMHVFHHEKPVRVIVREFVLLLDKMHDAGAVAVQFQRLHFLVPELDLEFFAQVRLNDFDADIAVLAFGVNRLVQPPETAFFLRHFGNLIISSARLGLNKITDIHRSSAS